MKADHARETYDALAPYYDAFTAHHDYDAWTRDLEDIARAAGLRGRRLLDVACGTGKSFMPFLERGYDVVACDISPAMLAVAAEKADGRVPLAARDMRSLPKLGEFDLVLCLDDALNYLLDRRELDAALKGMRANLAPGGLLIFDVNSLQTYRGFFASLSVVPEPDLVVVWRGRTPPDLAAGGYASATTEVLSRARDGPWTDDTQRHRQRHHPEPVIRDAAVAAGLRIVEVYGMTMDGAIREGLDELAHSKAVYLAAAAATARP